MNEITVIFKGIRYVHGTTAWWFAVETLSGEDIPMLFINWLQGFDEWFPHDAPFDTPLAVTVQAKGQSTDNYWDIAVVKWEEITTNE